MAKADSKGQFSEVGFVLLHGAGFGAWIWDDIVPKLNLPALAIDAPGRGEHIGAPVPQLTLDDYVEFALADINLFESKKVIIVAHSVSGVVGAELVRRLGDRVAGFIAVGAAIPPAGGSFVSCLPFGKGIFLRLIFTIAGTKPPVAAIKAGLCNDLDEKTTRLIVDRFVPESKRLYTDKTEDIEIDVPSLYVSLSKDQEFDRTMQERMAGNMRKAKKASMDTGHMPMLSKPGKLARILNDFAVR